MKTFVWVAGIIIVVCLTISVGYQFSETWTDTGKVNWVGQKFFVNTCESLLSPTCSADHLFYVSPYSILTLTHGTLNFTWRSYHGVPSLCGNAETNSIAILTPGTPVGIVRYNCGGFTVVFDP